MKKYLMVILGSLLCAIAFNLFMVPFNILPGGVSGISILINKFVYVNKSLFVFLSSLILLIISYILLGKEKTLNSLVGSILYPMFLSLTEIYLKYNPINIENIFLGIIFGGFLYGLGLGLIFKEGYTAGGTDIIKQIINKYFHVNMGTAMFITEGVIVLISGFIFGFNIMMYSIMIIYISSMVIDRVMLGISKNKSFYIITEKEELITDYIMNKLGHGVTVLEGIGAYSNKKKSILLTVIPTSDYYVLKEFLKHNDKNSFFVVSDSYEVSGGE